MTTSSTFEDHFDAPRLDTGVWEPYVVPELVVDVSRGAATDEPRG